MAGDLKQLRYYWQNALADAELLGGAQRTADLCQNFALVEAREGNIGASTEYYDKAAIIYHRIGDIAGECRRLCYRMLLTT